MNKKNLFVWPFSMACLIPLLANAAVGIRATIELSDVSEVRICWESVPGLIYQVQHRLDLDTGVWIDLGPPVSAPTSLRMCVTEPVDQPSRFFRVVGPDMVWIPPGTFTMGSPETEAERQLTGADETQHEVMISRGFWMGKYEVTQGEYFDVVGSNPSYFRNGTTPALGGTGGPVTNELLHPVEQVSWIDATNYCGLLTERERLAGRLPVGYEYRLATEAQWEYACRAGTTTSHHYGDELRSGMANFSGEDEYDASTGTIENPQGVDVGRTTAVGSYEPNAWGLYDMHGNVWEWCQDWLGDYPAGPVTDPTGAETAWGRVVRGGGWNFIASSCRSANRYRYSPDLWYFARGFRVALVAVP
jgi:sulfatase modifying factor 1